ncbi:porin [Oleiharenicola sp. Vm1]|uniref:porin n=1 Tax=Oleiharenicola sp. Vm1 TaxID=3398393 RepID=UPI0039F4EC06
MFQLKSKLLATAAALFAASVAFAQDSKALIDVLIKKGILNEEEAVKIQKDLGKTAAAQEVSTSKGKYLERLTLSGRFQIQYAGLGTDIDGTAADPAATNHFFMRRMYLGAKAELGQGWSGNLNYDFAGSTFDAAFVQWKQSDQFVFDFGFRKVPFGLEEWYTSSSNLRAIERSPGTRFFVESNNGRRLGAGSYRTGIFLGGKDTSGFFYNVAVTNPERDESAAGVTGQGTATTNSLAYWGNVGYAGKIEGGTFVLSGSLGVLPDQGGKTLGAGDDLTVYNLFAQITRGPLDLQLEYFGSKNDHGVSASQDSSSSAFSVQPAYKVGDLEYVVRYSYVDSDGRGLTTGDLIRSAPSGGTMDKLTEWFAGINYYIRGNDVKWQIGYIHGESKDTVTGGSAKATTDGIRSMMQLNF